MAKLQYKKENHWFSVAPYDIDQGTIWKINDNNNTGIVLAGANYPNSVWQNDNNQTVSWKNIQDFPVSSYEIPNVGIFYRYGQFVVWTIPGINPPSAIGNTTMICESLPEKYRPAENIVVPVAGFVNVNSRFDVLTNGRIIFYSNSTWNQAVYSTSWWLTSEGAGVTTV